MKNDKAPPACQAANWRDKPDALAGGVLIKHIAYKLQYIMRNISTCEFPVGAPLKPHLANQRSQYREQLPKAL
ncbi:hypothetical protein ACTJJ7_00530 [Phyllobacterium sp. 22229]|uniref:hypothetical protein n=1 Tax=Phyllobacterium sp. 22229 TaxID=3453895 RepID=UPI003F8502FF